MNIMLYTVLTVCIYASNICIVNILQEIILKEMMAPWFCLFQ